MKVPEGWRIEMLINITRKIQDGNYGASYPKADEFLQDGIPFLTSKVINDNKIDFNRLNYISEQKHVELNKAHIQYNDVLFTNRGARVGSVALVPKELDGANIGPQLSLIRVKEEQLDNYYLFCFLQSWFFKKQLNQMDSGSAMNFFGVTSTGKFRIPLPPLSEQRKIAGILGGWDEAITLTERLIKAKQRRKKALMQQLLTGKVRFGEFEGEWREAKLEEVANILFSNVDKIVEPEETSVRLCNYMDVYTNFYITNDLPFMVGSATENEIQKFTLFKDDVIITKDSETPDDIANAAVVSEDLENTVCGYHLAVIRPDKKKVDGTFLMHYLHHPAINNQFARLANGVTRYGLTTNSVKHAKVKLPPLEEQQRIAAVLQTCDAEIELLRQKLAALRRQKRGLMQQLLTGRVRV